MRCPSCQFESPAGMKFCGQCGAKLGQVCAGCGTENPPGFRFCGGCGAPLASAEPPATPQLPQIPETPETPEITERPALPAQGYTPPHLAEKILQSKAAIEGERKQVTVLFCDVVGSTALADRLGPEAMHQLLNRFFELALSEVHRYEGTINQFLGDGFMALFGAPIAHEDHARRAVLAALGLGKRMAEHRAGARRRQRRRARGAFGCQHRLGGGRGHRRSPADGLHGGGRHHQPGRPPAAARGARQRSW